MCKVVTSALYGGKDSDSTDEYKKNNSLTQKIKQNCLNPVPTNYSPPHRTRRFRPSQTNLIKKAESKISDGDIKGAANILFSSDVFAPDSSDTLSALHSKHPPPASTLHLPDPPLDSDPFPTATKNDILSALSSFKNGSAGGLDGLSPQHLKDLICGDSGDSSLLSNLTSLINLQAGARSFVTAAVARKRKDL